MKPRFTNPLEYIHAPPPDVLVPALAKLRGCRNDLDTLVALQTFPRAILPALAWAASRKTFIPGVAVETLVRHCGLDFLARGIGAERARALLARYAKREALSGL